MAPKKLTEADKQAILGLYRTAAETTSTLAERFGVSNSTISRLLKAKLPEAEYSALIQQKRGGAVDKLPGKKPPGEQPPEGKLPQQKLPVQKTPDKAKESTGRDTPKEDFQLPRRRIASRTPELEAPELDPELAPGGAAGGDFRSVEIDSSNAATFEAPTVRKPPEKPILRKKQTSPSSFEEESEQLALLENEALSGAEEDSVPVNEVVGLEDDDYGVDDDDYATDDEDDEEDYDGEDDEDEGNWDRGPKTGSLEAVHISPLTDSALPRLCYLVVDRSSSDLVTCPLKEFSGLGIIPENELNSRTLPVFDNHRIARRFSRRNQRVIKIPNGHLLQATRPYLMAKGITRLLIDGQVYAFVAEDEPEEAPVS